MSREPGHSSMHDADAGVWPHGPFDNSIFSMSSTMPASHGNNFPTTTTSTTNTFDYLSTTTTPIATTTVLTTTHTTTTPRKNYTQLSPLQPQLARLTSLLQPTWHDYNLYYDDYNSNNDNDNDHKQNKQRQPYDKAGNKQERHSQQPRPLYPQHNLHDDDDTARHRPRAAPGQRRMQRHNTPTESRQDGDNLSTTKRQTTDAWQLQYLPWPPTNHQGDQTRTTLTCDKSNRLSQYWRDHLSSCITHEPRRLPYFVKKK